MEREAAKSIKEWLDHGKEALLVTGARQIGKTYLIRECRGRYRCIWIPMI